MTYIDEILQSIDRILNKEEWTFYDSAFQNEIRSFLLSCWLGAQNDEVTSIHIKQFDITYIVSGHRASVIYRGHASYTHSQVQFVQYDYIDDDIYTLCEALQTAFLRLDQEYPFI